MFPPGKYAKSISRNVHYIAAFKESTRSIRHEEFNASSLFQLLARHDGYMVLDLHPGSDDSQRMFSHLLTHEGYARWHRRKRDVWSLKNGILKITSNNLTHSRWARVPSKMPGSNNLLSFYSIILKLGTKKELLILFRTFARKVSNIDSFLKILPLKDDRLVMSEM